MSMKNFLTDVVRNNFGANLASHYNQVCVNNNAICINYFAIMRICICLSNFPSVCLTNYCVNAYKADMQRSKRSRPPVGTYAEDFPDCPTPDTSDGSSSDDDCFSSEEADVVVEDRYKQA